jgi:pyridoxine/pyridoxamine 5'-phosphate oxidase
MNVASASKDGMPSSRMVLLKSYDENGENIINGIVNGS